MTEHPLAVMLHAAAHGDHPPPDGVVEVLPSPGGPADAIVDFTAHLVVAADVPARRCARTALPTGELSAWTHPSFQLWLAGQLGDQTREPRPRDGRAVRPTTPISSSRRATTSVVTTGCSAPPGTAPTLRVFTDADELGVLVVGRGLAGRWECAFEVEPAARNRGLGRRLALAARDLVPTGEALFAQVAPGNVASVRAVLAAGFRPIGGEVLFPRRASQG